MDELLIDRPAVEYRDRSTSLTVFGILTLLGGCLCALFVPLMLVGHTMAAKSGAPTSLATVIPGMLLYGGLAVALVWLGVGSIMARRWARALLLVGSWSWLIVGVAGMLFMAFMLPSMMESIQAARPAGQPPLPPAAKQMMVVIPLVFGGVIFIVLPGVWLLFYRSPHVKATCDARDPTPRWTDACPLPVLGLSLWLWLWVPMLLVMPLTTGGVLPCFGVFLTGAAGTVGCVVYAAFWAWCARALYRLDLRGWWAFVLGLGVMLASHVVTYLQRDVFEMYALMGYSGQQLEQLRQNPFTTEVMVVWSPVAFYVPFLGYLLYLRRFFGRPA